MKKNLILLISLLGSVLAKSQVIYYGTLEWVIVSETMPEHGFLPGKKFVFYPTLEHYNFNGKKMRVELYDERDSLRLIKLPCSTIEIDRKSEFEGNGGASKVLEYFQHLFTSSNIILDSSANDSLQVHLEALDSRLIGYGYVTAHGLCKMSIHNNNLIRSYCIDITDKDPHSPMGPNAFVTRKTATRLIASAAIRESIESILKDLKNENPQFLLLLY
jgi:hypothetical protein